MQHPNSIFIPMIHHYLSNIRKVQAWRHRIRPLLRPRRSDQGHDRHGPNGVQLHPVSRGLRQTKCGSHPRQGAVPAFGVRHAGRDSPNLPHGLLPLGYGLGSAVQLRRGRGAYGDGGRSGVSLPDADTIDRCLSRRGRDEVEGFAG